MVACNTACTAAPASALLSPRPPSPLQAIAPYTYRAPCTSRAQTEPAPRAPGPEHGPFGPLALGPFSSSPPVSTNPCGGGTPLGGSNQW